MDMGPTCEHVIALIGNMLQPNHINIVGLLCSRQYGFTLAKPQGSREHAKLCHAGDCTGVENLLNNEALSRVRKVIEPDRSQVAWSTKQGNREKKCLDSPSGGTARRRRGRHTLAARF